MKANPSKHNMSGRQLRRTSPSPPSPHPHTPCPLSLRSLLPLHLSSLQNLNPPLPSLFLHRPTHFIGMLVKMTKSEGRSLFFGIFIFWKWIFGRICPNINQACQLLHFVGRTKLWCKMKAEISDRNQQWKQVRGKIKGKKKASKKDAISINYHKLVSSVLSVLHFPALMQMYIFHLIHFFSAASPFCLRLVLHTCRWFAT